MEKKIINNMCRSLILAASSIALTACNADFGHTL